MRLRNVLGTLGVTALSVLPMKAKAEEFKPYNQLSANVSAHIGGAEGFSDIYGTAVMFGGSFGRVISPNLKIESGVSYLSKSGNPYTASFGDADITDASAHTSSLEVDVGAYFMVPTEKVTFYAGGGLTHIGFGEELSLSGTIGGQHFNEDISVSEGGWGFMLAGGVEMPVSPTVSVFGQVSYKSAKILDGQVQVGGTNIGGGLRLGF